MIVEEVVMMLAVAGLAAWVLWLLFKRHQLHAQARLLRSETFNRLVDKFGTAKEFVDFLQTDAGRKFLEDPIGPPVHPLTSVRRFVQGGVVLLVLGAALLVNALRLRNETDINYIQQAMGLNYWGTIFLGGGAALLIVAVVSYVLAKRWD